MNYQGMSDENVLKMCEQFGERARHWRRKFLGVLPEVFKRKLYEKRGFNSVFEFACKTGGVNENQVRRALNLEKRFSTTPVLREALVNGEISINKLARVAAIATPESADFWLEKSKILSNRALEVLVRDEKILIARANEAVAFGSANSEVGPIFDTKNNVIFKDQKMENLSDKKVTVQHENESQTGLFEAENARRNLHVHTLQLDCDIETELLALQEKGHNINELLRELLQNRKDKIQEEKQALTNAIESEISFKREKKRTKLYETLIFKIQYSGRNLRDFNHLKNPQKHLQKLENFVENSAVLSHPNEENHTSRWLSMGGGPSRHIPKQIQKFLIKEYGTKCAISTCRKLAEITHHTHRFALSQNHNPNFLAPLCNAHHEIAHSIDQKFQEKRK